MKSESYENFEKKPNDELYGFITERDTSPSKWKAMHVLEKRRLKPLVDAAKKSASAARYAAIAAFISALIAIASFLLN